MSAVQLCVFILFPYRFDGISSTKVATVQSTYNFTHTWVFSHGPCIVTRGDHFFSMRGDNLCHAWACGECCAPRPRVINYGKESNNSIYNKCTQVVSTILYVRIQLLNVFYNVGQFSTMPATQLQNQSTLTAEESMLQSSKESSFYICFLFTPIVSSHTYVAS